MQTIRKKHMKKVKKSSLGQNVVEEENKDIDMDLYCEDGSDLANANQKLTVGNSYPAIIQAVKKWQMDIKINGQIPGRVHLTEVSSNVKEQTRPFNGYTAGQQIQVWIIGIHATKSHTFLQLSHRHMKLYAECSLLKKPPVPLDKNFVVGDEVNGFIKEIKQDKVFVWLSPTVIGFFDLLNLNASCKILRRRKKAFHVGDLIKGRILDFDGNLVLTQLGSWMPKQGMVSKGRVEIASADRGLSVKLPHGYTGDVALTDMMDSYSNADPILFTHLKRSFVMCFILDVDHNTKHCQLSMRQSRINGCTAHVKDRELVLEDLYPGIVINGYVKSITSSNIIVLIGRELEGSLSISEQPSKIKHDIKNNLNFSIGSVISVSVIKIENEEITLAVENKRKRSSISLHSAAAKRRKLLGDNNKNISENSDTEDHELAVDAKFSWDVDMTPNPSSKLVVESDVESSSDEEEIVEKPSKKKKSKKEQEKLDEALLYKTEHLLMNQDRKPETPDDYDRLVVASPNNSALWLQYIALHLGQLEIGKARGVAEKALKTISFREEQEKFNIWIAMLNLENMFGNPESLDEVFKRAVQQNDPIKVYNHLIDIYVDSDKIEEAENLLQILVKKFKTEKDAWIKFGLFYMKSGKPDLARNIMDRSLKSLENKMHVDVIAKFAQMEIKHGDAGIGKSTIEQILKNYPNRTDLWSIYINILLKEGNTMSIRNIFEHVISLKLSVRKMKFFFKGYLDFEKSNGSVETVNEVKRKALQYSESFSLD